MKHHARKIRRNQKKYVLYTTIVGILLFLVSIVNIFLWAKKATPSKEYTRVSSELTPVPVVSPTPTPTYQVFEIQKNGRKYTRVYSNVWRAYTIDLPPQWQVEIVETLFQGVLITNQGISMSISHPSTDGGICKFVDTVIDESFPLYSIYKEMPIVPQYREIIFSDGVFRIIKDRIQVDPSVISYSVCEKHEDQLDGYFDNPTELGAISIQIPIAQDTFQVMNKIEQILQSVNYSIFES